MSDRRDSPIPRVSAVVPAYNAAPWIRRALLSLTKQTFANIEIIVIDDGSTDGTREIIAKVAASDARIRYGFRPHEGISAAANFALSIARGEYVARLDADDITVPHRVALEVAFMDAHPEVGVVGGQMIWIDETDRKRGFIRYPTVDLQAEVLKRCPFGNPATMVRRQLALDLGGFRSAFDYAEDYDLWLRIAEKAQLANLPEVLTYYRSHSGQVSRTKTRRQYAGGLVATALSVARRQGRPDPIYDGFRLTAKTVLTLGIDAESARAASKLLAGA